MLERRGTSGVGEYHGRFDLDGIYRLHLLHGVRGVGRRNPRNRGSNCTVRTSAISGNHRRRMAGVDTLTGACAYVDDGKARVFCSRKPYHANMPPIYCCKIYTFEQDVPPSCALDDEVF